MQDKKNRYIKRIQRNKYFYPIVIVAVFCIVTFVMLYVGSAPSLSQLKEGDIYLRTIYAPYDFTYPTSIDEEATELARLEKEAKVPLVYDIDWSVQENSFSSIDTFFSVVEEADKTPSLDDKEKANIVIEKAGSKLPASDIIKFMGAKNIDKVRKIAKDALENVYLAGIVDSQEKKLLEQEKIKTISIRNAHFNIERHVEPKNLIDEKEALKVVSDSVNRLSSGDKSLREPIYNLIKVDVKVNTKQDKEETLARKEKAKKETLPIYKRKAVKKNELIVEKGTRLSDDDIAKLTQITLIHAVVNRTSYLFGLLLILLGLVLVVGMYFVFFEKKLTVNPKQILLISINAFLIILTSLVIMQSQLSVYLIPLASVAMIITLLLNANAAFITTLVLSIYIGFLSNGKLNLAFVLFMGSVVSIYFVKGAKKRSNIFIAGLGVAVVNFLAIAGTGLLNNAGKEAILGNGIFGIANGIISSFIVIGLIPIFEYVFSLITNITLLELSDLSNPLLKELTIKAPGTYHHSILVGNLAEEACNSIGANSLLARVGSYYHDIGKIEKAEYFAENEAKTKSKHEKLTPSMSALIITNHTKDGVELARKYKINSAIIDFISQHHGTSLIYYFYQKALEKIKSEDQLKEEEFRYPGPKPQTKEAAIVHLADSVEASSRMLSDPTPARIRGLVQKIINNKFIDGQLDECDLTLKDLNRIADSFVRVLTGVFHTRIEYPDAKEAKIKKEKKNGASDKNK